MNANPLLTRHLTSARTMVLTLFAMATAAVACVDVGPQQLSRRSEATENNGGSSLALDKTSIGGDWPVFRGNSMSTGVAHEALPDPLDLLWKFQVDGGAFEGTAAIVDGVVYIGDLDGSLFALDLATGEKRWHHKIESGFTASPAVRNGNVYLGDYDGRFYCFDASSGDVKWNFTAEAEISSSANFYKNNVLVGSQDATMYCLNADSGQLVWKFSINDQIRCSPTVVENRAFLAGCDSMLHIVDLDRGESVARVEIDAPTGVTPAVQENRVFFGTEGGTVFAVNWREAKIDWDSREVGSGHAVRSSPAVSGKYLVLGSRNRKVFAFDSHSGDLLWSFSARQRVDSSPVIVGDRVFVGSSDGRLYGLDLKSGEKKWQFETGGGLASSPAVARGRLVIASDDGVVYCFGSKS